MIAVRGFEMIFVVAASAMSGQFTTGHGDEGTVGAVNDFEVTNNEAAIDGNRAKGTEPILRGFH